MAQQKTSEFYWACRNGDEEIVKQLLPKLKSNDINQIESNGSTALHAASYYGHANLVRILLEYNANTTIRNKYNKTPIEEASTDEIRALFEGADDDEDIPQSKVYQAYRNTDGMNKSALATHILKARLGTYQAHKYTIAAASNIEQLENEYRKICQEENKIDALKTGDEIFKVFRETGDFDHMIYFYSMETPFHGIVNNDETFHIEMYKHLLRYGERRVKNYVYRGAINQSSELILFRWALDHPHSLLETRRMLSASLDRNVALTFAPETYTLGERCLIQIDLTQKTCFTAIQIANLSDFPNEEVVLIIPGTFFSVTKIEKTRDNITVITLVNEPVDESLLLTTLMCFKEK